MVNIRLYNIIKDGDRLEQSRDRWTTEFFYLLDIQQSAFPYADSYTEIDFSHADYLLRIKENCGSLRVLDDGFTRIDKVLLAYLDC